MSIRQHSGRWQWRQHRRRKAYIAITGPTCDAYCDKHHWCMATINVPSLEAGRAQSVCRLSYGLEGRSFETRQQQEIFLFSKTSIPVLGSTQLIFNEHHGSLPRLKLSGLEVAHSLLCTVLPTARVMNLASVALCRHRDSKFHEWSISCGDHLPSMWPRCNKGCGWMLLMSSVPVSFCCVASLSGVFILPLRFLR